MISDPSVDESSKLIVLPFATTRKLGTRSSMQCVLSNGIELAHLHQNWTVRLQDMRGPFKMDLMIQNFKLLINGSFLESHQYDTVLYADIAYEIWTRPRHG